MAFQIFESCTPNFIKVGQMVPIDLRLGLARDGWTADISMTSKFTGNSNLRIKFLLEKNKSTFWPYPLWYLANKSIQKS